MGFFSKKRSADLTELDLNKLPVHVAVIMDGNGRWAKKRFLPRAAGHRAGMYKVKTIIRMSSDIGIKHLTLYAFSTENWKRPKEEVGALMSLLIEFLQKELDEMHERGVVFRTIGDISKLPQAVIDVLENAKQKTRNNTGLALNIALNYGSRIEIANAVKQIAAEVKAGTLAIEDITQDTVSGHLETAGQPDPDFMIRTSGEERLSNYLLYQLAYAEFYFTPVYWPDFDEHEYEKALLEYQNRQRRYGGL
ncbi:isoprenyl transferase [Christensenella tenuis]|uniref:Isoprenyl transferase n=1 Tax=Christensenella tenuis TaxID=2763033 RepID=A0ABR7EBP9_9FIRM|nr:isoprenyl transferase [Christensenella tenuis]MBC5647093.1 isoprenyl transferase [Christensenella tenuis]